DDDAQSWINRHPPRDAHELLRLLQHRPHDRLGGFTPNPRKLKPATTMMLTPIDIAVTTRGDYIRPHMAQDDASGRGTDRPGYSPLLPPRGPRYGNNPGRAPPEDATKIFRLLAVLSG
ncbi:hypothetical protein KAU37_12760, partial [Candidatus Bipolaricaulota bacterium]|nr:hypothetical protein [Candidatus Bipolaricaulota bacterium]